jgi:hypothetical protein
VGRGSPGQGSFQLPLSGSLKYWRDNPKSDEGLTPTAEVPELRSHMDPKETGDYQVPALQECLETLQS